MTFSFATPPTSDLDKVRFFSGDTVEKNYSVSDEDIAFLLSRPGATVMTTAADVADRIADWWLLNEKAVGGDKKVGPFSIARRDGHDLADAWREKARSLRAGGVEGAAAVDLSGAFTGYGARPQFAVGMHDAVRGSSLPPELGGTRAR